MLNPRKTSPALYELIGRQTRVTSGKQIGGRETTDGHEDEAHAPAHHAHAVPPPRPAPVMPPPRRYTPQDEAEHERRAPGSSTSATPLRVARPPVHAPAPPPRERAHIAEPESLDPAPTVALGPGRAVRVPTGYFLFGLAAVLAAAIGGYMFGFMQKEKEVYEAERQAVQRTGAILTEPLGDEPPVAQKPPAKSSTKAPAKGSASDPQAKPTQNPTGGTAPPRAGSGVIVVGKGVADPRTKGLNYAVVASLGFDRAVELAEFLSGAGVESAVLSRDTGGYYPVVSLRGFAKEEFSGKARQDHENRLRELGKQYAKQGTGRKDFSDLYWWKYAG